MQRYFLHEVSGRTFDRCQFSFDEVALSSFAFDYVACKSVGADEVAQLLTVCFEDRMSVSLPEHLTVRDETDLVAYFEDGVHVMGVYDSRHIELLGKVADEAVDENGSVRIQS